jgi:hypothetical protein
LVQKDETSLLPLNTVSNSTATTKTLTTEEFDPFGNIFYYGVTGTTGANAIIATGSTYQQILIDLRYSTNVGKTLTANKSVYLVAQPQSNGKAKLASTAISQTLPTTDDGKIYIYLGVAYNAYQVDLTINHPIYQFKNGQLRQYVGSFGTMAYQNTSSYSSATDVNTALSNKADKTAVDNLSGQSKTIAAALNDLNGRKLDASAYTPTDLSNYYTKSETSGATEISDALSGKVDTNTFDTIVGSGYTNTTITEVIENMDTAIAAALNDLNSKIGDIESILATI